MNAAQIKVVEYNKGDRFRITDREHAMCGRTGTLEFQKNAACRLMIDGQPVQVDLNHIEKVPPIRVVGREI